MIGFFGGEWYHNFGHMRLSQTGTTVTGTYDNAFFSEPGTIQGTVAGTTFDGSWSRGGATGAIQWTLTADGQAFTGYFRDTVTGGATFSWCGARPDQPFPDGCSFAGEWLTRVDGAECRMTLTRINTTITGTDCRGTLNGTISAPGPSAQIVLSGTRNVRGLPPRPFTFYLGGYDPALQFRGNWTGERPNEWCGWRAGSRPPEPCVMS